VTGWFGLVTALSSVQTFKVHIGSVALQVHRPGTESEHLRWRGAFFRLQQQALSMQGVEGFAATFFSFIATAGFLPVRRVTSLLRAPFEPRGRELTRRQKHFHGIMMTKQTFGDRALKPLNDTLISVNIKAPTANICFVVFHFFGHTSYELTLRINLKQLRPH